MCSIFSTNNQIEVLYHTSAHPCISLLPRSSLFVSPNANKTKTSRKHYDPQKNTQKEKLEEQEIVFCPDSDEYNANPEILDFPLNCNPHTSI